MGFQVGDTKREKSILEVYKDATQTIGAFLKRNEIGLAGICKTLKLNPASVRTTIHRQQALSNYDVKLFRSQLIAMREDIDMTLDSLPND